MPTVLLPDRTVIAVTGEDAEQLLQNVVTCEVEQLGFGSAVPGALLTPQGKILFDFLLLKAPQGGFLIDIRADETAAFIKRMTMYKLRSKADFSVMEQHVVATSFQPDSGQPAFDGKDTWHDDRFWDGSVFRHVLQAEKTAEITETDLSLWHSKRVEYGVVESGADYALGDAFPHDVSFDSNGGVDFRKGCYVGQEVVSRMQHRGTARRRVMIVEASAALHTSGADVTADGKPVGTLGTVVGDRALMIGRIDRVHDARTDGVALMAEDIEIKAVQLPPNVAY
ncbi:MAG: folate-binding protein, partial [Pseudomonadota bacterium]